MKLDILLGSLLALLLSSCTQLDDPKVAFEKGNYERSFQLWQPLAKNGDLDAQNYLGVQYFLGLGVTKDYQKAVEWYERAAKKGHADAQRNLGDMNNNGLGVKQDHYQAFIWYFASAQQGSESGKVRLEALSSENKLSPNQQMHGKIEANEFILDPGLRFMSHDTYVDKNEQL